MYLPHKLSLIPFYTDFTCLQLTNRKKSYTHTYAGNTIYEQRHCQQSSALLKVGPMLTHF